MVVQKRTIRWAISLFLVMLYFSGLTAQAQYGRGSETTASVETNTYVFLLSQSTVVQTGGIAGVHWTYSVEGLFQLTVAPDAGTASFAHVDANATDDSPLRRTLDPNEVFNMTSLIGTLLDDTTISFTGKAADGSDVFITVTIEDDLAYLVGQTIPPPNTADFFLFSLDAVAQRKYGGGTGEPNDPYQIGTAADLMLLGESPEDYDKHFILTADIDLDPNLPGRKVFDEAIIAPYTTDSEWLHGSEPPFPPFPPFTGVFDGNSLTISNLAINGIAPMGLFGVIEFGSEVKNLGVVDVDIVDFGVGDLEGTAGLVGKNYGSVVNCYSICSISGQGFNVGGLVGKNYGSVNNCYVDGEVSGNKGVGGLVGWNFGGSLTNCYSICSTNCYGDEVGGLVGRNWSGTVSGCYGAGAVNGNTYVGGLVGYNSGTGGIANCYGNGEVSGNEGVGGLVGLNRGSVINCYSTGVTNVTRTPGRGGGSGIAPVGALVGMNYEGYVANSFWEQREENQDENAEGTGKTKIEMQMESTFTDVGWDFVGESENGTEDIWSICEGTNYPRLVWQIPAGDFVCPDGITIEDFEFFIEHWRDDNCDLSNDYCQGTDLDFSGTVDEADLEILFENLLQSQPIVPPQPPPPPGPPPPPPKVGRCFPADTPVWVNGALVPISNVVSGQMVGEPHCDLATDCLEQIEAVEEHEGTFECRDVVLESGNRISVVDAHCFMLDSGQWIAAQDLRSGLRLKTLSGTVGIKSVATRAAPFVGKVYNLKVTGVDRYLVSEDGVIVRDY